MKLTQRNSDTHGDRYVATYLLFFGEETYMKMKINEVSREDLKKSVKTLSREIESEIKRLLSESKKLHKKNPKDLAKIIDRLELITQKTKKLKKIKEYLALL